MDDSVRVKLPRIIREVQEFQSEQTVQFGLEFILDKYH